MLSATQIERLSVENSISHPPLRSTPTFPIMHDTVYSSDRSLPRLPAAPVWTLGLRQGPPALPSYPQRRAWPLNARNAHWLSRCRWDVATGAGRAPFEPRLGRRRKQRRMHPAGSAAAGTPRQRKWRTWPAEVKRRAGGVWRGRRAGGRGRCRSEARKSGIWSFEVCTAPGCQLRVGALWGRLFSP